MLSIIPALLAALALGAAPTEADAGASTAAPDAVSAPAPARVCAPDVASARAAVTGVYAQLAAAYGDVLPGPRGQTLMQREVDRIILASVDVEGFARASLREAWDEAPPEQRARWQLTLARMLHQRYRPKLRDPGRQRLTLLGAELDCDQARVWARLDGGRRTESMRLEFRLRLVPARGWQAWDATIDGSSLVRTWRKRFASLHGEGGLPAVERYIATLAVRYPCDHEGCPR